MIFRFSGTTERLGPLLTPQEMKMMQDLAELRLHLPFKRELSWVCFECHYETAELSSMHHHIKKHHKPMPLYLDEASDNCYNIE